MQGYALHIAGVDKCNINIPLRVIKMLLKVSVSNSTFTDGQVSLCQKINFAGNQKTGSISLFLFTFEE